ncbi:LuxR family two component transcriptional regulator [Azospirillum brasilense]|uniref:LuxR family two component transcriptional regulator n=1 Tax=Azospirillum brasilense TaxID=192 RepID=A0A560C963_AZOBR|nr:response regulator [Azospirillum brasilense]MBK3733296.1 response regulator [Azospirillum brasilense]TWA81389.1 LuxR family two component transcriptional regulator [Azospirillum brasilense]
MCEPKLHIVDDDEAIRDAMGWLFQSRNVPVASWPSAEAFLADYDSAMAGCLLLDIRMEGMSGLELFDRLTAMGCRMPVLFLTGHGDVPIAVSALKKGARDFVEKPFNDNDLVDRVIDALAFDAGERARQAGQAGVAARLATLTQRERQVMGLVVAGKLNKVIADELGISMRTVEVHRAHVFEKMGVKTAVELARILATVG